MLILAILPAHAEPYPGAVLNGLDKVTGRVTVIHAKLHQPTTFGYLRVLARACDKPPPEDPPEAAAWLEIIEERPGSEPNPLFKGWMFASSPGINALEHPVYDVWVRDCESTEAKESAKPASSSSK